MHSKNLSASPNDDCRGPDSWIRGYGAGGHSICAVLLLELADSATPQCGQLEVGQLLVADKRFEEQGADGGFDVGVIGAELADSTTPHCGQSSRDQLLVRTHQIRAGMSGSVGCFQLQGPSYSA